MGIIYIKDKKKTSKMKMKKKENKKQANIS